MGLSFNIKNDLDANNNNSKLLTFLAISFITIAIYIIVIVFILPKFYIDDFQIFSIISKSTSNLPHRFYLSLRPFSYGWFKFEYAICGLNPIGMKLCALILHVILIFTFFNTLILISHLFQFRVNFKSIALFTLVFSLNPESSVWIFVINNQTELVSTLFYGLSIYMVLKYFYNSSENVLYLILSLIFYTIAILSKQQPLHFPLLVLFLLFIFRDKINSKRFSNALIFSLFGVLIMLMVSYINLHFSVYSLTISDIYKKPFSIMGLLASSIFPVLTDYIYYFVLFNKPVAIILSLILLSAAFLILYYRKTYIKIFIEVSIGFLIILYPRLYLGYTDRINSILIYWSIIFLFVLYNNVSFTSVKRYLLNSYALFMFAFLVVNVKNYKDYFDKFINQRKALVNIINDNYSNSQYLIACSLLPYLVPYDIHFENNGSFGKDENLKVLPINCYLLSPVFSGPINKPIISANLKNGNLKIQLLSNKFILDYDLQNQMLNQYPAKSMQKSARGYSVIELKIPTIMERLRTHIIYYNGMNWERITKN